MKNARLPRKPSSLILLALSDLEKVEKDKRYEVNMNNWHFPGDNKCHVCLAGAVLAKHLNLDIKTDYVQVYDELTKSVDNKLEALNCFRVGNCAGGFSSLGIHWTKGVKFSRVVTRYEDDKKAFKDEMNQLAKDLKKAGY